MSYQSRIIPGFNPQGVGRRPAWVSGDLHLWYWILRCDRPCVARRRQLYRWIAKEKLRLAELCIDQELIDATCRYLSSYSAVTGKRMLELMDRPVSQMCLNLWGNDDQNSPI